MALTILISESAVTRDGKGPVVDIEFRPGLRRYLTLSITRITEHQILEMSVWGSPDGDHWDSRPLAKFPPKFYCGVYSSPLDLSARPNVRFLRVQWKTSSWRKEAAVPLCDFYVCLEEQESRMRAAVA
jgi:hypothetical protein